ncbi:hypothetical protein XMD579_000398 [Marinobacterium sp. xm-d-579]|uniref:type IV pilus modification PilV family protein n=1 Tax=Marinobacterium sp. xm-d-579 TaxID=2497734 RepID=UPI001568FA60|nr:hypothetical protein [Marinobacterium sp. xm-d-579]NRP35593.1 hypothetical protein [Marinobacterium sp. xm-d-579]
MQKLRGFVLIEAMVALVVSVVGLLGIALFSSQLFSETTNSKARAEAIVVAQKEMELLRHYAGQYELASIATVSVPWPSQSTYISTNQSYSVGGSLASESGGSCPGSGNKCSAVIEVSWGEPGALESVQLSTIIVSDIFDSTAVNGTGTGVVVGGNPYAIDPPSGNAQYGDDAQGGVLPSGLSLETVTVSSAVGSSEIRLLGEVESVTKELLTYSGTAFAEIRGVVYVDNASTTLSESDLGTIVIRPSDTGVCPKGPAKSITGSDDWFFEYRCFFGDGWYGSIQVSVVTGDSFETDKTQCVGDPTVLSNDGTLVSRHAQIAVGAVRRYRGYSIAYGESGPLFDGSGNLLLVTHGMDAGDVYGYGTALTGQDLIVGDGQHDFVLVSNQGGGSVSTDAECETRLGSAVNSVAYTSYIPGFTAGFENFVGNTGDYVCLEVNGTRNCPTAVTSIDSEEVSAAVVSITGAITAPEDFTSAALFSTTSQFPTGLISPCYRLDDGSCDPERVTPINVCSNDAETFSCSVFTSVSGSGWSGTITHTISGADFSICDPLGGVESITASSPSGHDITVVSGSCAINYLGNYDLILTNGMGNKVTIKGDSVTYTGNAIVSCGDVDDTNDYINIADGAVAPTLSGLCSVNAGDLSLSDTITVGSLTADVTAITPASGGSGGSISATLQP